jgi:ribonuclease HII
MTYPTLNEEKLLWNQGLTNIAGVDEVGRGCFAGPVVAAAVIFPKDFEGIDGINDSKLLTALKREALDGIIKAKALAYSIAEIPVAIINDLGIGRATQQAFHKAITDLKVLYDHILIDAFYIDGLPEHKQKPIIHGDRKSTSIAAASIIAKVYRDQRMKELHPQYAVYDFFTNKGYGTKKHREAIKQYGLCPLHRTSFNLNKFTK